MVICIWYFISKAMCTQSLRPYQIACITFSSLVFTCAINQTIILCSSIHWKYADKHTWLTNTNCSTRNLTPRDNFQSRLLCNKICERKSCHNHTNNPWYRIGLILNRYRIGLFYRGLYIYLYFLILCSE